MHPVAAPGQVRQGVAQIGVILRRPVDRLGNALAIGIVAISDAAAALAHGRQRGGHAARHRSMCRRSADCLWRRR